MGNMREIVIMPFIVAERHERDAPASVQFRAVISYVISYIVYRASSLVICAGFAHEIGELRSRQDVSREANERALKIRIFW